MSRTNFDQLLQAGCHFGHLRRKWNPAMAPYIFMERNGIHIIDLHKTVAKIDEAAEALKQIAKSGKKILFVATKKQAKEIVAEKAASVNMPYVIERWPGGMLTNFPTIRKAVKKMANIDRLMEDGTYSNLSKRELLQVTRQRAKLEKNLGSISDLTRLPSALFVVDVMKEHIAIKEAPTLWPFICRTIPRVVCSTARDSFSADHTRPTIICLIRLWATSVPFLSRISIRSSTSYACPRSRQRCSATSK